MGPLRLASGGLVASVLLLAPAARAEADPARPTNDRSEVVAIEPAAPGVRVDVVGGDAFLRVRVEPGRAVEIPGYDGEPYLRIGTDGVVERNDRSPARWLNSARYGPTDAPPPDADADAPPEWSRVGTGGDYVWHDHRIHYMGQGAVPARWEVPLVADGQSVTVKGTLDRQAAPGALPWFVLAAVMFAATLAGLARARRATLVVVAAVGALAAAVSVAEARALPGEAGGRWWLTALAGFASAAALAALAGLAGRSAWLAAPCTAGAGVALVVWGVRRAAVLDHAVLLTALPDAVDRAAVALALGVGAGAAVGGVAVVLAGPNWTDRWLRPPHASRPATEP